MLVYWHLDSSFVSMILLLKQVFVLPIKYNSISYRSSLSMLIIHYDPWCDYINSIEHIKLW
jgi:hypothetical protein